MAEAPTTIHIEPERAIALATQINDVVRQMNLNLRELYNDVTGHIAGQAGLTVEAFKHSFGYSAHDGENTDLEASGYFPKSVAVATTLSELANLLIDYANNVLNLDRRTRDAIGAWPV